VPPLGRDLENISRGSWLWSDMQWDVPSGQATRKGVYTSRSRQRVQDLRRTAHGGDGYLPGKGFELRMTRVREPELKGMEISEGQKKRGLGKGEEHLCKNKSVESGKKQEKSKRRCGRTARRQRGGGKVPHSGSFTW